jgi:hypothetical protein
MKSGLATRTRNVFHLIDLSRQAFDSFTFGTIRTWQFQHSRGWTPATCDAADFPHLTGFGCYERPETLANAVLEQFHSIGQPVLPWSQMLKRLPQLQFIPPAVFKALADSLRTKAIEFSPPAPDLPSVIGVLSS